MRSASSSKRRKIQSRTPKRRARGLRWLPVVKELFSIALMLGTAGGLLIILQLLLARFDLLSVVSEAIADLIRGFQQLFEGVLGFGAVALIVALVVVIAVLLMGGSWRCWRLMHRLLRPRREGHSVRKRYGAGAKAR